MISWSKKAGRRGGARWWGEARRWREARMRRSKKNQKIRRSQKLRSSSQKRRRSWRYGREDTGRGAEAGMRLYRERTGRNGVRNKLGKTVRGKAMLLDFTYSVLSWKEKYFFSLH
jgi:hypothetical protein